MNNSKYTFAVITAVTCLLFLMFPFGHTLAAVLIAISIQFESIYLKGNPIVGYVTAFILIWMVIYLSFCIVKYKLRNRLSGLI